MVCQKCMKILHENGWLEWLNQVEPETTKTSPTKTCDQQSCNAANSSSSLFAHGKISSGSPGNSPSACLTYQYRCVLTQWRVCAWRNKPALWNTPCRPIFISSGLFPLMRPLFPVPTGNLQCSASQLARAGCQHRSGEDILEEQGHSCKQDAEKLGTGKP